MRVMPDRVWLHPMVTRLGVPTTRDTIATHLAIQAAWRSHVLTTLHPVWRWRVAADSAQDLWPLPQALAVQAAGMLRAMADLRWNRSPSSAATHFTAAVLQAVRASAAAPTPVSPWPSSSDPESTYIVFFDGGSRGNPGPGGSGAVVLRMTALATAAEIVWSAATAKSARTTTNNQAEYDGLIHGLKAAAAHGWTPLEVVGDSSLILNQMRAYRAPKALHLCRIYAAARRLADALGVIRWIHHLRAFNRMADTAANVAMDTQASSRVRHPTSRSEHAQLGVHLDNDFAHWQETRFAF